MSATFSSLAQEKEEGGSLWTSVWGSKDENALAIRNILDDGTEAWQDWTSGLQDSAAEIVSAAEGIGSALQDLGVLSGDAFQSMTADIEILASAWSSETEVAYAATRLGIESAGQIANAIAGSKKQQAIIGIAVNTALGVEKLAEGIWPPNPAALIASGQHFLGAIKWGVALAKTGGGGGGGSGGGGGGGGGAVGAARQAATDAQRMIRAQEERRRGILGGTDGDGATAPGSITMIFNSAVTGREQVDQIRSVLTASGRYRDGYQIPGSMIRTGGG